MKKTIIMALIVSLTLVSCKEKDAAATTGGAEKEAGTEKEATAKKEEMAPVYVVNEADWVETDLSKISDKIQIIVKLPKNTVFEKTEQGGIFAKINDNYLFVISEMNDVGTVAQLIEFDKGGALSDDSFTNVKTLKDEPNGYVYTRTMKEDKYSKEYDYDYTPESHFFYVVQKGKLTYTISDDQSPSDVSKVFTEDAALKAYDIIKNSAKVKG